jgi:hypothetical protein
MNDNTTFAVIAFMSALAMFGVVMVTVATTMQLQQAEGLPGCEKGFPSSAPAINNSKGRCLK